MHSATFPAGSRQPADATARLAWGLMLGVLVLLIAILVTVVWLSYRSDRAERQEQVIADTLWVKQSIEFQLSRHAETMQNFAQTLQDRPGDFIALREKVTSLLAANHEMQTLLYVDSTGRAHDSEGREPQALNANALKLVGEATRRQAVAYGRGADGPSRTTLYCAVPVSPKRGDALLLSLDLRGLLNELVPWWLARESQVALANAFGEQLVEQGFSSVSNTTLRHQTPIELPGETLVLVMNSARTGPSVVPRVVTGSAVALGIMLSLSLVLLWRDMRQRVVAERALSEQLAFRKAMEDSLVTGLRARDVGGVVTFVNQAFCKMVGYTAEELLGHGWKMPFYDPAKESELLQRHQQLLSGTLTPEGYETEFIRRDGARLHVLIHEAPLLDAKGIQTGWMSSILDITDLKRAEELNRQQQEKLQSTARLVTMGEVATALSHELNQPLSAITSYITGSLNIVGDRQPMLQSALQRAQEQADRAGHIIRSVHDFVRRREAAKTMCNIAQLVDAVMPLVQLQARKLRVRVETEIAEGLPQIAADPTMLEQVLLNLTRNAIEAMAAQAAERRVLRIEARESREGERQIEIAVVDHGIGIDADTASKLFTAFYTTKPEGMGVGLSICRTAVELHRGHLWFEHTPGGGATFRFTLQA
jgi:two-component system, LuxR family, sensor histidine kinase DctS